MRIAVYPHDLNMGGSQFNAIELAAAVRDAGHEVIVAGQPGSLVAKLDELGLEFVQLPAPGRRPSLSVVTALRRLVIDRGLDIIHGYEWPPSLEALLACSGTSAKAVSTVLSMSVAPFIPRYLPLLVGTEQIAASARERGGRMIGLMEPPVDTEQNSSVAELGVERESALWGVHRRGLTLTVISRLVPEMKLEGILTAIDVVGRHDGPTPVQLLIVGSGSARKQVERAAHRVNEATGEQRIVLTGELEDPRWAYAVADVALGMGSSALRAMAFGKPLVVQGEQGFWQALTEDSLEQFLWQGWYGCGKGPDTGAETLAGQLAPLLADGRLRDALGQFALRVVIERHALPGAAQRQIAFYEQVLRTSGHTGLPRSENFRAAASFAAYRAQRFAARLRGTARADDFNARPTATSTHLANRTGTTT